MATAAVVLALSSGVAQAQGVPNVAQTPGELISGLLAPDMGRLAIVAFHNGLLYSIPELPSSQPGSDFQVRSWNIADLANPVELEQFGVSPMPINAHGYLKQGNYLSIGANWPPEAPWSFRATTTYGSNVREENPDLLCAGVRGCLFGPWFIGETYWSYNEVSGNATIQRDWVELANWDHLGMTGVIGHPVLLGDVLYFLSDQSRTGVASYDVSDPTNPVLLDVLTTGGPGGYWPEVWAGGGKLYGVFPYRTGGNGMRVVDLTDSSDLRFLADVPLPGAEAMYVQFQDEFAFIGDHKVDMRTFQSVLDLDGANAVRPSDGGTGVDTSQFALPIGNLLVTGGIGPNQGMAIWAHQTAPDTRGPEVTWSNPAAGRSNYPVGAPISLIIHETLEARTINASNFIVRPLGGSAISGDLVFAFDDVLTFTPDQPLAADTTYEVVVVDGGIEDVVGNGIVGTSWTFSTGSAVGGNGPPTVTSFSVLDYPVSPGAGTTLTATATDPELDSVEYRFDAGDGSPPSAWSSAASIAVTYAAAGHYRATVQARDPAGALASRSTTVTVVAAPSAGPRPRASTPIVLDDVRRRVWRVHPDNDTLAAVDADGVAKELEVPTCERPSSVALTSPAGGQLWVACRDSDELAVHDAASGALLHLVALDYGSGPVALLASADGATVFVALESRDRVVRFDAASRAETGALALGPRPRGLALSGDGGQLFVSRFLSGPHQAQVWQLDPGNMSFVRTLVVPKFGGDEHRDTTASGKGVLNYLTALALSPDGASLWVSGTKPNEERGVLIDAQLDLDSDNSVRNVLAEFDLSSGELLRSIDLDNSDSATALAFSPLGDYLAVALQGTAEVLILDALAISETSGLGSLVSRQSTGLAPQGALFDPATGRLFVADFLGRTVTSVEADPLLRSGTVHLASTQIGTVADERLAADVLLGKQIFYHAGDERMSAEGYLSCATCHLDGGHDGRTWDFTGRGEGLRNTTDLRGRGGVAQGNVHWSANFDEIHDFENDIRGAFGGRGFLSDSDFATTGDPLGPAKAGLSPELDALAAYVTSLGHGSVPRSPFRNADGSLTAAAVTGRQLFLAQGCASCHGGAEFTNSSGPAATLVDVGTLRTTSGSRLGGTLDGIDVPTLFGLWDGAPFLHDGSAETLAEVFSASGGEVLPAETGSRSGGATLTDQYTDLNNDDTVRGRAYVGLEVTGARITWSGVEGGTDSGEGAVEIRYSASVDTSVQVEVNGVATAVVLPGLPNVPSWRHTQWSLHRVEGVTFSGGSGNTVSLWTDASFPNLSVDEITVSTPDALALAAPHRRVGDLDPVERAALFDYLQQIDGRSADEAAVLFADGFEDGNTATWSTTSP